MVSKARIILWLNKYLGWNISLLNYIRIVLPYRHMIQFEHFNATDQRRNRYACNVKFFGVSLSVNLNQVKRLVKMFCLYEGMILMEPSVDSRLDQYISENSILCVRIVETSAGKSLPGRTKEFTLEVFVNDFKGA